MPANPTLLPRRPVRCGRRGGGEGRSQRTRGCGRNIQLAASCTGESQTPDNGHRRDDYITASDECAYNLAYLMGVRDRLNNATNRKVAETIRCSLSAHLIRCHNRPRDLSPADVSYRPRHARRTQGVILRGPALPADRPAQITHRRPQHSEPQALSSEADM